MYNEKLGMTNQKMQLGVVSVSRDSILCKLRELRAEAALWNLLQTCNFYRIAANHKTTQNWLLKANYHAETAFLSHFYHW